MAVQLNSECSRTDSDSFAATEDGKRSPNDPEAHNEDHWRNHAGGRHVRTVDSQCQRSKIIGSRVRQSPPMNLTAIMPVWGWLVELYCFDHGQPFKMEPGDAVSASLVPHIRRRALR